MKCTDVEYDEITKKELYYSPKEYSVVYMLNGVYVCEV